MDCNKDNQISEREWDRAYKNIDVVKQFSKLVIKHKNEWSYTPSEIADEAETFFKPGIDKATGAEKTALIKQKDKNIETLKVRIKNLCFWKDIEDGQANEDMTSLSYWIDAAKAVYHYMFDDDKKTTRSFDSNSTNVWHFHPIAFVEQMKLMVGGDEFTPVENPQITIFTHSGRDDLHNSAFGGHRGRPHTGLDIFTPYKTALKACLDGKVV